MSCPLLLRSSLCRAVADGPHPIPPEAIATYCRGDHLTCPAYRYLRATGHAAHPADFRAWVVRGTAPGRAQSDTDLQSVQDPG